MSKRSKRCGKVVFASWREAERAANSMYHSKGALLKPYSCPTCGKIHVGHPIGAFGVRIPKAPRVSRCA